MKKFINSFYYAALGIRHCFLKEQNFRIHSISAVVVVTLAILFQCNAMEWMILLLCIGTVIALEMINTAVEQMCNMQQTTFHPVIKIIKDVAAGAVLICAITAAVCGGIIFIPKIISCFNFSY